jgi:ATPase subunit of ABC transporter with duplicated ATPase domains
MPACLTLADLSFATPDGTALFDSLNLSFGPCRTGLIGRNGIGKSTLLAIMAGQLAPTGGRVLAEGRIGFLRQAVTVAPEETLAEVFGIAGGLALLEAIAAGQAGPEALGEADWTLPARFEAALARVGLPAWPAERRMAALSGGQRTRALIAALIFGEPEMILLDEPTNNLDAEGRAAVAALLDGWRGGAVVVSHDRDLLDRMEAIGELTS